MELHAQQTKNFPIAGGTIGQTNDKSR